MSKSMSSRSWPVALASGLAGVLFGLGLIVSGMSNPAKVIGFLDLSKPWDPSLMLVMAGAIAVALPGFWLAKRRQTGLLGQAMQWPGTSSIDRPLLVGAVLFGAGWGLGGFCPGPALVASSALLGEALLFTAAMLLGMWVFSVRHR
ncbi:DUF6691 family protein [Limnobacter sp.]|uniref:DUF6691 family protein n=1 Tax=Limnobacter sp. TaxID=2003368 RepID=UPI003517169C